MKKVDKEFQEQFKRLVADVGGIRQIYKKTQFTMKEFKKERND